MKWSFLFAILGSIAANSAEYREFYLGARALGMGGAHVAVVNDETALITNPAALGKLRNAFSTLLDPEVHGSSNNAGPVFKGNFGGLLTASAAREQAIAEGNTNKHFHLRYNVFPSFVVPNFGIGILRQYSLDAYANSDGNLFEVQKYTDTAAIIGYNLRIWDGRIKFGFNLKAVNRNEIDASYDPQDATNGSPEDSSLAKEGFGFAPDAGLILTAPWRTLPTLAVVARNVGNLKFSSPGLTSSTAERPTEIKQSVDVGLAMFPIINKNVRYTLTLEARDVLTLSEATNQMDRAHIGGELNLGDILYLRLGWHQRSVTTGAEFATENMQFQFATYSEQVTHNDTASTTFEAADLRYVFKFALRF